jgi:cob(I)alamin adenosyltransferase
MRITKVYTRTGDTGDTGLANGDRVSKNHPRIEACGAVDELSSAIGLARAELARCEAAGSADFQLLDRHLAYVQNLLFDLGGTLAAPPGSWSKSRPLLHDETIAYLEKLIDAYNASLPPLRDFILPAGSAPITALHLARAVARRAERCMVTLQQSELVDGHELTYLNRFSDLLFVVARWVAQATGVEHDSWIKELEAPPVPTFGSREVLKKDKS